MGLLNFIKHFVINLILVIVSQKHQSKGNTHKGRKDRKGEPNHLQAVAFPKGDTGVAGPDPSTISNSPKISVSQESVLEIQPGGLISDIKDNVIGEIIDGQVNKTFDSAENDKQLSPDYGVTVISKPQTDLNIETHHLQSEESLSVIETELNSVSEVQALIETEGEPLPQPETNTFSDPLLPPVFQEADEVDINFHVDREEDVNERDDFNNEEYDESLEDVTSDSWENGHETIIEVDENIEEKHLKKRVRKDYYAKFLDQRSIAPELTEQEIDVFLKDLETDNLESISSWPLPKLENYLFHALQRSEFVGEFPISNKAFIQLAEYIRCNAKSKGKIDQKRIPPVLFLIGMVFCARYSESDARNFWEPYASMVWGLDAASLSFQQKCRKHFVNCREDLHQVLSLNFRNLNSGDVVRPVYQHAIIPSYIQGQFAEWLVNNFEALLQYPAEQLPLILQNEKSLDYIPRQLRDFIRGEETKETAAHLITRMSNAVKLFHETEQGDAVESVMSSSIERSLWQVIYKKLINDQSQLAKLRRFTPRLEWCWDLNDDEVFLNLSNVRSDRSEKPDSVTWAAKDAEYLKGNDVLVKIYPGNMGSGDWEINSVRIPAEGPLDGNILVLSEDFDLDEDKQSQYGHIIFERTVPPLQKPVIYFRVNPRRNIAVQKEQIDSDGSWIIVSSDHIQVTDNSGNQVQVRPQNIPYRLREAGYIQAGVYSIQPPVTVHLLEKTIIFESTDNQQEINPFLRGVEKVSGLSTDIPPVFCSPNVDFLFSINPSSHYLRRTWLSIRRNGEFLQSIVLADLVNQGKMRMDENLCDVDLTSFLTQSGAYSINLLYNLRSLFDEPVQFAWLPEDVEIVGPRPDVCYSPLNPLQVTIRGVSEEQVIPIHDEKSKITTEGDALKIEWKMIRNPQCRFDILWECWLIHFCWNIDRVSAWIEGGGDKNQVSEGQEQDVVLQVRGQPKEDFSWIIEGMGKQRNTQLNARGEFYANLLETEVRDMLLEDRQARSTVSVAIRGCTWKLFDYFKKPGIEVTKVNYQKPTLEVSLTQIRKLRGTYIIQVRQTTDQSKPEVLSTIEVLENNLTFQVILNPGEYRLEILLYDVLIQASPTFQVEGEPTTVEEPSPKVQVIENYGSPEHLFRVLTATKQELLSRSYDRLPVTPAIEQLQLIHTPEEWLTNECRNEGLKRLLPSWAVLMYPLRFTTKNHRRIFHAFPEKVAYGGRAGRGYVELKLAEEKMRIAASWRPGKDPEYSELWMGISQERNIRFFSELDQDELWPAYQCKDCGTIVASRNGPYIKLPPSVVRLHLHGKERKLNEQFIDTVYDEQNRVEVSISQYKEKLLLHAYWAKDTVFNNYLKFLIEGKTRPVYRDLEQPINLFSNNDYGLAVSDLFEHLQHPAIHKLLEYSSEFDQLDQHMEHEKLNIPAFSAMQRLMQYVYESASPLNIPGNILSLAMALRLKPHQPQAYNNLLANLGISEDNLVEFVKYTAQGCPKMLEWSIAWAELFYVHAIS